uniref:Profilin n=1 Tax=Sinocyclocheilus rhinocerous TaxID=307959 RepID=A0A673N4J1_9TELE
MSWDSYISSLTKSEWVDDAVILGCTAGQESVWASAPGGWLNQVTVRHLQWSKLSLIIAKGVKDAHGGKVNPPVFDMTTYLRKMNM